MSLTACAVCGTHGQTRLHHHTSRGRSLELCAECNPRWSGYGSVGYAEGVKRERAIEDAIRDGRL